VKTVTDIVYTLYILYILSHIRYIFDMTAHSFSNKQQTFLYTATQQTNKHKVTDDLHNKEPAYQVINPGLS
jgi:hypothetical protein